MNPYNRRGYMYTGNPFRESLHLIKPEEEVKTIKVTTINYGDHSYEIKNDNTVTSITYKEVHENGMVQETTVCELYSDKAKLIFAEALKLMGEI